MNHQEPRPEIALLLELVLDLKRDQSELKQAMALHNVILERNTTTVEQHERRSTQLEGHQAVLEQRLERLELRDNMLNGFVKISLGLMGAAGAILALVAAVQKFL